MTNYIKIHPNDNVIVATMSLAKGALIAADSEPIALRCDVPMGHKIALKEITQGDLIIKYGYPIGHAIVDIKKGDWVNEKNIKTNLDGVLDYAWNPIDTTAKEPISNLGLTFKGYLRENGDVGIRNEIWVIPTVGCVNGIAEKLAQALNTDHEIKGIDAIVAYPHNYGCSQLGEDHENTRKILKNMVLHPNVGGALIVGLGCENNQPEEFMKTLGDYDQSRIKCMVTQKVSDEFETGMTLLKEIYTVAKEDVRTDLPLSELKVGLKCGGSDGFSGITANPLLGRFSDFLVAQGGTTVLTEVPEMFGAETLLMNRCGTQQLFDKTVHLINDFKGYFITNDQPIYENPSPGNKAGGISTLEEKSLGCTQKSGTSAVKDVLMYGDRMTIKGLNLLSAPGNDLVASTALAASGCHLVLFTTGRGTPFGTFVPTMKISTNSNIADLKPHWIDFNAGVLLEGQTDKEVLDRFVDYIIRVASGEKVNNEKSNYHEFAIFKTGVTL